ncbi:helix-turn-helix transcriptional regulator [Cytobacillus dafuensis]|uniref:Helix-turn-helix transcriptional regulator n=1 Tax=Cytobacillus dafuensis TaxID=1742359 RepID=A0A5B8Z5Y2_CYTDA|nr:helix-turn-helix transcriptional regulator [Cytobacillus dafuensis]QED47019.1 helix-turn-helix transcriptional regulator [Cytobacillus dafuensis]
MIGSRIKYYRINANLTQEELCKGVCSPSYLSKVENNNMEPSEDILRLLCERMKISLNTIRNFDENEIGKKIENWYELLKVNTDKEILNKEYEELNSLFISQKDSYQALKFKIFNIKYFIKTEEFAKIDTLLHALTKYQSTMSSDLLFFYYYFSGMGYYVQSNFCEAEEQLLQSLEKIQSFTKHSDTYDYEISDIFYYLSLCYGKLHQTHRTKEFALKSLRIADKILDHLKQIKLYVILGINEGRTKSYSKAIEYYEKAIKIAKAINHDSYTGIINHNLGYLYSLQDKSLDAIVYYHKSLHYIPEYRVNRLIITYFCLAREYKKIKQHKEMKEVIKKARSILSKDEEYKHHFNMLELQINDSIFENRQYIKEVIDFFTKKNQWIYVMEYAEILAISLESNFQYKEAVKLYKIAHTAQKNLL